jgi:hypothetical protein
MPELPEGAHNESESSANHPKKKGTKNLKPRKSYGNELADAM